MITTNFKASAVTQAIRDAIAVLKDMMPVYRDIVEYMVQATRQRFADGQDPDGNAWAAKKPSTLDRYKRLGYGNLNRVLIGPGRALSRQIVGQATASGAVIGSALIYSRVMQEGASKGEFGVDRRGRSLPWGNIPARVWLGVSAKKDEPEIIGIVEDHLADKLGNDS